jgi:hypothetical protein
MSLLRRSSWTPPPPEDETSSVPSPDRLRTDGCVVCGVLPGQACGGAAEGAHALCRMTQSELDAGDDGAPEKTVEVDAEQQLRDELVAAIDETATEIEAERAADPSGPGGVEVVDAEPADARPTKAERAEIVVHPRTGEAIEIRGAATNELAGLRDAIVDWERSDIAGWKRAIDEELRGRLDHESVRSATVGRGTGRFKITVPAPTKTVWDAEQAYKAARELVRQGLISETAAGRAVERVVEYKAKHAALIQLAAHADERVRDAIGGCRSTVAVDPKDRRISVSPVRAGRSDRDDT